MKNIHEKGIAIVIVVLLLLGVAACGSVSGIDENDSNEEESPVESSEENTEIEDPKDIEEVNSELNADEEFTQIIEDHAGIVISSKEDEQYAIFSIATAPGSVHGIIDMNRVREASENGEYLDILEDLHDKDKTYVDRLEDHARKDDNTIVSIEEIVISPDFKKIVFVTTYEDSSKEEQQIPLMKVYIASLSLPIEISAEIEVENQLIGGPSWNNNSTEIHVITGAGEEIYIINGDKK